ncbi:MAG: hypothetical protein LUG60_09425 [Erysipelotrichaceae bacterium]|nr:hypothetical protein [Erysipelotrichaceae bacterium]
MKGLDDNYLSMDNTLAIKGIFVVLIFLSHIRTYTSFDFVLDTATIKLIDLMSQLVVTMFLFYSGYGIYESIKTKNNYIQNFPKHRIGYVFMNLILGLSLYMILNIFIHKSYPIENIILSFIGLKSIGNSSWFMFAILILYITAYLSFRIFKKPKQAIMSVTILSIVYVLTMTYFEYSPRYSCTHLCFALGMWYSYYHHSIDAFLKNKMSSYYFITIGIGILMILSAVIISNIGEIGYFSNLLYNIIAMFFSLFIVFCSMKISFCSRILIHINDYAYMFLFLTILILVVLVEFMNAISTKSRDKFLV